MTFGTGTVDLPVVDFPNVFLGELKVEVSFAEAKSQQGCYTVKKNLTVHTTTTPTDAMVPSCPGVKASSPEN